MVRPYAALRRRNPGLTPAERLLLDAGALVGENADLAPPPAVVEEAGKGALECRILVALGDPGGVAEDAERAERLDEAERAPIEGAHLLVALEERLALAARLL